MHFFCMHLFFSFSPGRDDVVATVASMLISPLMGTYCHNRERASENDPFRARNSADTIRLALNPLCEKV